MVEQAHRSGRDQSADGRRGAGDSVVNPSTSQSINLTTDSQLLNKASSSSSVNNHQTRYPSIPTWTSLGVRLLVIALTLGFFAPIQAAVAQQNVEKVWSNDGPLGGYQLGDFDGDGKTDLFRVVGSQWQYSASGTGPWQDLATDPTPQADLRFGDFDNDGRTDVFSRAADGRWRFSSGGVTNWINLATDQTSLSDLRFGDFNGDGRTDVFSVAPNGRWRYSDGGQGGWQDLAIDNLSVNDLRFGYFDNDNRIDVFSRDTNGQWRYSSGGAVSYQALASDPAPLSELYLGDFNGDGITDVFNRTGSGQWRYSPSGTGSWVNLASDPTVFSDLRFGDFNGDNTTDVFSVGSGSVPRYSAGGQSSWINLDPGQPTPTPTSIYVPSTPIDQLRFGDFNGDNTTDVFRTDGGQWQYSSAGTGPWQNLAYDPLPLDQLRFGDFNGDGRTDVFSRAPDGRWRYSDAGLSQWISLASDPLPLDQLRFGDFNGDGRTDVFSRAADGRWRYSDAGQSSWIDLATDPLPLDQLRFGDFNGDGRTDVFSVAPNGRWRYSDAGQSGWIDLATENLSVYDLRFGDFNGDGRTDVFSRTAAGQWRYSDGGQSSWINLASDPLPLQELRFGDFNGDGRTDVFSINGEGRWRYSDAGISNWILLGPPSSIPPTATPTRVTPYPTSYPTGYPPSGGSCPNILDNGGFETNIAWEFGVSPTPGKYSGAESRGGIRSVQLGQLPNQGVAHDLSYSSVRQLVMVPMNAAVVTLRWWHISRSEEGGSPSPTSYQDRQEVILLTPSGETLRIIQRVRQNNGGGWQAASIDLTEFAGQTFYVYFNVYNDGGGGQTWMYLDDVALEVCAGPRVSYGYDAPPAYGDPYNDPYGSGMPAMPPGPSKRGPPYGKPGGWMPPYETETPTPTATATDTATPTPTPTVPETPTNTVEINGGNEISETDVLTEEAALPLAPLAAPAGLAVPVVTAAPIEIEQAECTELVNNGNFEVNDTGWSILAGPAAPNYSTEINFNNSRQAMRLGLTEGENRSSISAIDQIISLPDDATSIVLGLRYYPLYEVPPGPGDLQYVDIYNALTGQFAGRVLGVQADDRTWLTTDYDLSALAGQTVRLVIAVNNDGVEGRTAMYVDNVSIVACNLVNIVAPLPAGTPPISGVENAGDGAPQSSAGNRPNDDLASTDLPVDVSEALTRLGTFGVMAGVLGAIGFAAFVIVGTLGRQPN